MAQGILRSILGGLSESSKKKWPDLERSWAAREIDMPRETEDTIHVGEMGPISKILFRNAYGITGPLGNISLNRGAIERDKQNLDDVLTHELTHVGQGSKAGILGNFKNIMSAPKDYNLRPMEKEAFQAEQDRKVIRNDIELEPMNKPKKNVMDVYNRLRK